MKKLVLALALAMATASIAPTVQASDWFGGGNNGEWKQGPNGPYWDESDWPEWTPMYWMEEFMDEFDNNSWGGNNWGGGNNFGGGNNYGNPYGGYNQAPYGYGNPYGGYGYPQVPGVPVRQTRNIVVYFKRAAYAALYYYFQ